MRRLREIKLNRDNHPDTGNMATDYVKLRQADILRRRKSAESLLLQSQQPQAYATPLSTIAQIIAGYYNSKNIKSLDEESKNMFAQEKDKEEEGRKNMLSALGITIPEKVQQPPQQPQIPTDRPQSGIVGDVPIVGQAQGLSDLFNKQQPSQQLPVAPQTQVNQALPSVPQNDGEEQQKRRIAALIGSPDQRMQQLGIALYGKMNEKPKQSPQASILDDIKRRGGNLTPQQEQELLIKSFDRSTRVNTRNNIYNEQPLKAGTGERVVYDKNPDGTNKMDGRGRPIALGIEVAPKTDLNLAAGTKKDLEESIRKSQFDLDNLVRIEPKRKYGEYIYRGQQGLNSVREKLPQELFGLSDKEKSELGEYKEYVSNVGFHTTKTLNALSGAAVTVTEYQRAKKWLIVDTDDHVTASAKKSNMENFAKAAIARANYALRNGYDLRRVQEQFSIDENFDTKQFDQGKKGDSFVKPGTPIDSPLDKEIREREKALGL